MKYHVRDVNGYSETVCITEMLKLLDEDTKDHHTLCPCKRCKLWRRCLSSDMVRYEEDD